jgi:hypothetical protein
MRFQFTVSLNDYKSALKLHRKQTLRRRLFPWIFPSLLLISLVVFVAASVKNNLAVASQAIAVAAGSFAGIIALPTLRFLNTRKCYRLMFPPTRTSAMTTIEIDDERIVEENPGTEEVRLPWSGVLDFVQDEKATLIYINPSRFFLIPTSALTPNERGELSTLVSRHMVKR